MPGYGEWQASVAAVLKLLKARFPNLTAEDAFDLAASIVQVVLAAHQEGA